MYENTISWYLLNFNIFLLFFDKNIFRDQSSVFTLKICHIEIKWIIAEEVFI